MDLSLYNFQRFIENKNKKFYKIKNLDFERNSGFDTDTVRSPTISRLYKEEDEGGEVDSIYHTISRGVSYTPVLKKIGSR